MQIRHYLIMLLLMLLLTACGGSSAEDQADDAAPAPQDVPAEAAPTLPPNTLPTPTPAAEDSKPEANAGPAADAPILTFAISGGIVGFCDELEIDKNGNYTFQSCQHEPQSGALNEADLATVQAWRENLAEFELTSEDNPKGPDNLVTHLVFRGWGEVEADERQKQMIFDWTNGLVLRVRPQQAEPTPTPAPVTAASPGVCPEIQRPALLTIDINSPDLLYIVNPDDQTSCEIALHQLPFGRIAAADHIYYPIFDATTQIVSVVQLSSQEAQTPLSFTQMEIPEPAPFNFVISDDGTKIAWAWTEIDRESDPPLYRNNLWVANIDGTAQTALLDQAENQETRFVAPIRFSAGNTAIYYALQPDIPGLAFSGRFDNLHSAPVTGGEAQLHYACPAGENPVCITGVAPDANVLTVIQPGENQLQVVEKDGNPINTIPLPATDYIERAVFGPDASLAFVSAVLSEGSEETPALPNPGYITVLSPPYTGQPQTLLSGNNVGTLQGWLDESRLVFGAVDESGNLTASIVTLDGQITELSPNITAAILR